MTKVQHIRSFIFGIITLIIGIYMFIYPENGLKVIASIICLSLIVMGVNRLIYYFTMSRHMVGGRRSLITGLIITDLGVYALMMQDFPPAYIIIYLLAIHGFTGIVDMMGALDAKRTESKSWRLKFITGTGNLAMAVVAVIYGFARGDVRTVVYIYAAGICYTGVMRMINACRKTAITYIQ